MRERLKAEQAVGTAIIMPAVVLYELAYGIAKSFQPEKSQAILDSFLSAPFPTPPFDAVNAREAGAIRAELEKAGTPIGAYDVLIAAQARRRGAILVTANKREFARVSSFPVVDWSEV